MPSSFVPEEFMQECTKLAVESTPASECASEAAQPFGVGVWCGG
jgi:hypothetical protein